MDLLGATWGSLAESLGFALVPVPNRVSNPSAYLGADVSGIILSGGGDIDKDQSNRDRVERALLREALLRSIPLLGVCRGAQLVALSCSGRLIPVDNHVRVRHRLQLDREANSNELAQRLGLADRCRLETFNSFHDVGIAMTEEAKRDLQPILLDDQGNVEMFAHRRYPLMGIMWHPERESPMVKADRNLLSMLFTAKRSK